MKGNSYWRDPPHIFLLIRMMGWEDPNPWHPVKKTCPQLFGFFFRVKLQSHNHLPPPRVSSLQSSWKAQHSFEDFPGICPGLGFYQKHVFKKTPSARWWNIWTPNDSPSNWHVVYAVVIRQTYKAYINLQICVSFWGNNVKLLQSSFTNWWVISWNSLIIPCFV